MPVYASFDYFDGHLRYLTPGKRYLVTSDDGTYFRFLDDDENPLRAGWIASTFLGGRDWTRHEEPDAEPMPELPRDLRAISLSDSFALHRTANGGWIVDDAVDDTAILAAFTNTADLLAGLPALLGGASPVEESMTDEVKRLGCPADCRTAIAATIRDMKMRGGFKW